MSGDAEGILARADAAGERAARWLRDLIVGGGFGLEERPRAGWGSLSYHHEEAGYVVGVFPRRGEALLVVEHGHALGGFDDVFDGGGRQIRTVVVRGVPDPREERIVDVVLAAVALRLP